MALPWLVVSAVLTTIVCVLLYRNFASGEKKIQRRLTRLFDVQDSQFGRELDSLLGPPLLDGNRCEVLRNGDEIFPAMLAAIRSASKTITFETYIYWSGDIGGEFADALSDRARAGVKVHLMLDWVGSEKMKQKLIDEMSEAGVQVRRYHPLRWYDLARMNNRTHRKLLVVDGEIGFTGGVGIAPQWTGRAQDPHHWRDTHFRVKGPVVAQMQAVFLDNWEIVSGEVLHGPDYFPRLKKIGEERAQMFSSSESNGSESMELMYLLAISSAARSIDLSSAYFVPGPLVLDALIAALRRGVKLRVIVPGGHIDSHVVREASRAEWGGLLAEGALIAEYGPTMYHCKVLIVDRLLVSVGSTNFDNRSFRLNDEATLNIMSPEFAAQQEAIFEDDLVHSVPIGFDQWRSRPWYEKLAEKIAATVASQL